MREKIVAGNWKMNNDLTSGLKLTSEIIELTTHDEILKNQPGLKIIICPPFILLPGCAEILKDNPSICLGAQNCHSEEKGAYTGEVSTIMLKSAGAEYVIIGHSERRMYFLEDNIFLNNKTKAALKAGLTPIFCCGEVLKERESGDQFKTVETQIRESIFSFSKEEFSKIIIAYEPVWAIGTGVTATKEQAQEMHAYIRELISKQYGTTIAENAIILYGGSCNAANASELFSQPDVDGGLIGGASLKAADFIEIAHAAAKIIMYSR
jgi:triosephosphate isomerase (TIM)